MRSASSILILFLTISLFFLLPLPSTVAQDLTGEDLTILSASGDGTCFNTGLVALNCTMPFTLTLSVVNFVYPPIIPIYSIILNLYVSATSSASLRFDPTTFNATSTSLSFRINFSPFSFPSASFLNASLTDTRNGSIYTLSSPKPYPAFTLLPYPAPYITSVSGCQPNADPLVTFNCRMDVDTLTLTGGGFAQLSSFWVWTASNVTGSRGSQVTPTTAGVSVNDTVINLSLSDTFGYLIVAAHYRGLVVSVWLSWTAGGAVSDKFNITLLPPPLPIVTALSVTNEKAVVVGNLSTYPTCVPGIDTLMISGKWLYDVSVTVGGYPCTTNVYSSGVGYQCLLPIIEPFVSGAMYDVVVQNEQGVIVLPGVVGFTSLPSLAAVSVCWWSGLWAINGNPLSRCVAGETLTVTGRRFMQQSTSLVNVTFTTQPSAITGGPPFTFTCLTPTILNDTTLTCVLPPVNRAGILGQALTVGTTWSDGYSTNQLTRYIYDWPNAPRILCMQGCGMSSNLSSGLGLQNCQQGEVITLQGTNLEIPGGWLAQSLYITGFPVWYCAPLTVQSNRSITCQLATAAEYALPVYGAEFTLILRPINSPGYGFGSNAFTIAFTSSPASSSGGANGGNEGSSGDSMTVAVVASVLSVMALLGLVAAGVYYSRTRCPETGLLGRRSTDEAVAENGGRGGGAGRGWWQLFPPSLGDSSAEVELE